MGHVTKGTIFASSSRETEGLLPKRPLLATLEYTYYDFKRDGGTSVAQEGTLLRSERKRFPRQAPDKSYLDTGQQKLL